jgi:signal transduction histidine kinase
MVGRVTDKPCSTEELRTLFLFEKLTGAQLDWLCRRGRVESFPAGPVYAEGDPATAFYVLLDGTLVLSRRVGADEVELGRTSRRGVYAGAWQAYLGNHVPQLYSNSMRVTERSRFFTLDAAVFASLVQEWFPMAVHLMEGHVFYGVDLQERTAQRERLLALGSLSAGLTHELNNPAAAGVRAAAELRERVAGLWGRLGTIAAGPGDRATLEALVRLREAAVERVPQARPLPPLEAADAEDAVTGWLESRGLDDGWQLAPPLVAAGLGTSWLETIAAAVPGAALAEAVRWLCCAVETELLIKEIGDATTRISELVGAAKQYAQLDRAPYRVVDVHELLDSTLLMLAGKIPPGIRLVRQYDRSLPAIPAYAAELNQVWTNLIDNAVAAMGQAGVLTVRTGMDTEPVVVDICDTGPGVPREIRDRIFEPFFTTKPVGQGTGLGLSISWRIVVNQHHGDIQVESAPGSTRFRVRLPAQVLTAHVGDGAEGALTVQQRLERVRVRVHHQADDDHVVARGDKLLGPADQPLALAREPGRPVVHVPGHALELVGPLAGERGRQRHLAGREDVDTEPTRLLDDREQVGVLVERDQDHRRLERQRGERAHRRPVRLAVDVRGHHRHRGRHAGQRVTEDGGVDPVDAGSGLLAVRIGCAAVLHHVSVPRTAWIPRP